MTRQCLKCMVMKYSKSYRRRSKLFTVDKEQKFICEPCMKLLPVSEEQINPDTKLMADVAPNYFRFGCGFQKICKSCYTRSLKD